MKVLFKKSLRLLKFKFFILSAVCSGIMLNVDSVLANNINVSLEKNGAVINKKKETKTDSKKYDKSKKDNKKTKNEKMKSNSDGKIKNKNNEDDLKIKNIKEPSLKYIKEKKLTTDRLLIKWIRKELEDEEILKLYFKMPEEKIGEIIGNDWNAIKEKIKPVKTSNEEKETIKRIIKKIQKREIKRLYKKIPVPGNKNRNVVVLTPGFGYEDPGAVRNFKGKRFTTAKLNAYAVYYLTKSLLKQGFEVYVPFDLSYAGLALPKDDPYCHVIYDSRPPLRGPGDKCRIADADHIIIKTIFKKLIEDDENRNLKKKMCSICIHHNSNPDKKVFGFNPYYEDTAKTSKKFASLSKKLANIFYKYGTGITPDKNGEDASKIICEDWLVCHFGGVNEKELKEFDSQAAVFLERDYISNKTQLKKLLKIGYMRKSVMNFTKALCEYFNKKYRKTEEDKEIDNIVQKLQKKEKEMENKTDKNTEIKNEDKNKKKEKSKKIKNKENKKQKTI